MLVRLKPDLMGELLRWIDAQPEPKPSRPEAIRRLLSERLLPRNPYLERGLAGSEE